MVRHSKQAKLKGIPKVWHALPRVLRPPSWGKVSVLKKSDSAKAYELPNRDHAFHRLRGAMVRAFQLINEFERILVKCLKLLYQSLCSRSTMLRSFMVSSAPRRLLSCALRQQFNAAKTRGEGWSGLVPSNPVGSCATGKECSYCESVRVYRGER